MQAKAIFVVLGLGFAMSVGACASNDGVASEPAPAKAATPTACDPLALKPIALGTIVGVGTDESGTSYVDATNGVFVSVADELDRQHVTGSGQSGTTEYLFSFEPPGDPARAQTLLIETDSSGAAQAMAIGLPGSRAFLDQADSGATPLTLGDSASISGLTVVNTPNQISYVADVENGAVVIATVPMNRDAGSESGGLSIFYGPPDNVEERKITAFEQSKSNNGTVTFLVGSDSYVLAFGTVARGDNPFGDFTLEGLTPGSGAALSVMLRSPTPTELPSELSFRCLP